MQARDSPSPAWSARSVNAVMTATYWAIGRRIVEAEQRGRRHADYGERYPHYTASVATGFASTFNPELADKRPLASVRFRPKATVVRANAMREYLLQPLRALASSPWKGKMADWTDPPATLSAIR
jgi:hypothetical protein